MLTPSTLETLSPIHLETVVGGRAAARKPQPQAQPQLPFDLGDAVKGCLTGAVGGILTGPHGALVGCALGAGKSVIGDIGKSAVDGQQPRHR